MNAKKKNSVAAQGGTVVSKAVLRGIRMSPQKARLVIDLIRGKAVEDAINILRFLPKKGAKLAQKLLESAIHNAKEQKGSDIDRLFVQSAFVDCGQITKRYMPRAQGRANVISKRTSHITVHLGEKL